MSTPPSWTPVLGEKYGDWVGVSAGPNLVFWDLLKEGEKTTAVYQATQTGVDIPADVRFALINSEDNASYINLPIIEEFGVGEKLHLQSANTPYRIRCAYDDSQASINQVVCNVYNELYIPAECSVVLVATTNKTWKATILNKTGLSLLARPTSRGAVNILNEYGYESITSADPTEVYTDYDGIDDYYQYSLTLGDGALFSIAAWIYPEDITAYSTIAAVWGDAAPNFSWVFRHDQVGNLEFVTSSDGTNNTVADSSGTIPQNQWSHVAAIFNAGTVDFYINNVAAGTVAGLPTPIYSGPSIDFTIAAYKPDNLTYPFNGRIAHLAFEEAEWTSGQRTSTYNSAPNNTAWYFPYGNGSEKKKYISELAKKGSPTTISDIPIVSNNTRRCFIHANSSRDIVQAPQLRAGQECVIRTDTTHNMIFPYSVDGDVIYANDLLVSDWRRVMKIFPDYNYHIKALRNNEYQILEIDTSGIFTAPAFL